MPKATRLHPKGKTSTIQKPCNKEKDGTDNADPEESMRQFQLELFWCIQQCERFLSEKKGTEKQSKFLNHNYSDSHRFYLDNLIHSTFQLSCFATLQVLLQ